MECFQCLKLFGDINANGQRTGPFWIKAFAVNKLRLVVMVVEWQDTGMLHQLPHNRKVLQAIMPENPHEVEENKIQGRKQQVGYQQGGAFEFFFHAAQK